MDKTLYLLLSFIVATVVGYDGYNPVEICAAANSEGTLLPHEECNKFYECAGGRPVALECPDDTLYNPDIKRCDWKGNVNCGNRTLPSFRISNYNGTGPELEICAAANSEGTLLPHEECNKFYECAGGRPVALECPDDTLYNPDIKRCDWKGNVNCGNRTQPAILVEHSVLQIFNGNLKSAAEDCAASNSEGLLLPHEECNKFYECAASTPIAFDCPDDTLYNPNIKRCDWPENVDCSGRALYKIVL